jgi:alpha-tubulin suppressor-like RCC1 family protein
LIITGCGNGNSKAVPDSSVDSSSEKAAKDIAETPSNSMLSAGFLHSVLLKEDGSLWAWGYNEFGQLGDGTTTNKSVPMQVLSDVRSVKAGAIHTLAVKKMPHCGLGETMTMDN